MTGLQIALILIGVVLLLGSFFVTEKMSSSDLENMRRLNEKELRAILDREMESVHEKLSADMDDTVERKLKEFAIASDRELNSKIMSVSEYSDTVLDSMNKSHNEIIFMYEMLNDKQQQVSEMIKELGLMQSAVAQMEVAMDEKIEKVESMSGVMIELEKPVDESDFTDSDFEREFSSYTDSSYSAGDKGRVDKDKINSGDSDNGEADSSNEYSGERNKSRVNNGKAVRGESDKRRVNYSEIVSSNSDNRRANNNKIVSSDSDNGKTNHNKYKRNNSNTNENNDRNKEILRLSKDGLSEVEIAKKTGRGLGEVKLVLGLFGGGAS